MAPYHRWAARYRSGAAVPHDPAGRLAVYPSLACVRLIGLGIGLVVTAATDAIVGNTPVDEAGEAGGIQGTAIQLGGLLGTAVCGSILGAKVAGVLLGDLLASGVPPVTADRLVHATAVVSQVLAPTSGSDSRVLADAITRGSHAAFMNGLHLTMLVAGVVALVGAAMGPFIRRGSGVTAGPEGPIF